MSDDRNIMLRAADLLHEAIRIVPQGYWQYFPQGRAQYPQRVMSADGTLTAECYEGDARQGATGIARYLTLASPETMRPYADMLHAKGEEWNETVDWILGEFMHVGGCKGAVGDESPYACRCFDTAQTAAQAVLDAAAYAGPGGWGK
jgi:hypothetical protein